MLQMHNEAQTKIGFSARAIVPSGGGRASRPAQDLAQEAACVAALAGRHLLGGAGNDHLTAALGDDLLTRVGAGRLSVATGELLARAEAGTLRHDADPRLAEHVTAAGVKHSNDAGVVLSRRASSGPIAAAVATALAVYGVAGPEPAAPAVL